ncbi:hypothetical protein BN59_02257 [Legionella massiliensis]|uniref:Yip1 domain protein n=1 Tax=Legionella massiliensis TaxID=1034943 RepID=A0A078KYG2_9GAMM|nr:hypothetical protein [Legionella massiliensis]CDZ77961.1 hypothetical protein BN59_02257 [Legionella massiliensis]CEE13699.1 hypothetical protein BN1094_02257 [Legionella massiliensis]
MNKEETKLLMMRKDNKISESDYQMLLAALNKKSLCTQIENSIFINPFQKIAGFKALTLGLILLILMSALGVYADVYFDGTLGYMMAYNIKAVKPNLVLLIYQNLVSCLTVSCLFILAAVLCKQKRIRIIDFFGTVAFSRYPIFISLIFFTIFKYLDPQTFQYDRTKEIEFHLSFLNSFENFVIFGAIFWQLMTYFFAFKESSGMEGKNLWGSFFTTIILGEVFAVIFTRWFFYV